MRIIHPKRILRLSKEWLYSLFWYYFIPDRLSIQHSFKKRIGYYCNFKHPQSYNEKIQWLKLNDRRNFYKLYCDKYEVKRIVGELIGEEHIIPTIGKWKRFKDIDFTELPEKFVLKCNHDSASIVICKDKTSFDYNKANIKLSNALKNDYYHNTGKQWAYKGIKRYIIAEPLLENSGESELIDYKFMVFNGKCKCILASSDRFSQTGTKMDFYDTDWNLLPFVRYYPNSTNGIPKPSQYNLMVEFAEKIAQQIGNPFIRVDFYEVNQMVYFGETTFYPGGGLNRFTPQEWDFTLGSWIDLNRTKTT